MLNLGCTLPNLANICLHKSTEASFYSVTEGDIPFWKKFEKMLLVVYLSFLHGKQLLMKLFFENQQTYANPLLGLTLANYTSTRCVNTCWVVFIRVGISIQKRLDSYLDKTRPAVLKIWSFPISNEQDQNVKLKAFLQRADRKKLTVSVSMGFVFIATLCWSHGLLSQLLSLSRAASLLHWRGYSMW